MMKKLKYTKGVVLHFAPALLLALIIFSCNKNPKGLSIQSDNFEKKSSAGLVIKKNYVVRFNKVGFQYVYNIKRGCIRIQADDQSVYVNAIFKDYPKKEFQVQDIVNVDLIFKSGPSASETRMILSMIVLKRDGEKFWLWNEEQKVGLIIDRNPLR